jgi:cell division protein FtsI/penicillin-binding protein 2
MARRKAWIGGGVVVGLVALAGVVVTVVSKSEPDLPVREVRTFLQAWERFDVDAMAALADRPEEVRAAAAAMKDQLSVTKARFVAGALRRAGGAGGPGGTGEAAEAPFTAELELAGLGTWSYSGRLQLDERDDQWRVRWAPAVLHPALAEGQRFGVTRQWPERAPILGADGTPLVANGDVTVVGLQPGRIANQAELEGSLQQILGVAPAEVRAALAQPWVRPDYFVAISEVRPERFVTLRPQLEPLPGVFFQRGRSRLAPSDGFAAQVLGRVGEVTAERLAELGLPYVVGDRVGLSGLEGAFERRLAGAPSGEVQLQDMGGGAVQVLHRFEGTRPEPVKVTLDRVTQAAAEQALAGVSQPAAVVAVDAATGDVRAVASRPLSEEFNRALAGRYPPGSTFKVVTAAALVSGGLRPDETVPCPAEVNVGGRTFVNFESGALGPVPFSTAFAQSCNTAFVSLASRLPGQALGEASALFGFGSRYDVGLPVAGGQFPPPADATEQAAAAIGQGRVLASPLHMATVAAAVANGSWRAPRLVDGNPPGEVKQLDPSVVATLRPLMAAVVREGSGTAAARTGQEIAGKTGTAEFGPGVPPQTHAWFVGFRGSLAFAVLVEGGGVGGRVAAPIAGRFLDAAPRGV